MSKKLRVFFLSVLAVVLVASSASAALTELTRGNGVTLDVTNKTLTISADGYYELPNSADNTIVEIDELILTASADEVELRLPAPYYSVPGEGIPGKWKITVPAGTSSDIRKLTINKMGSTAAAIVLEGNYNDDDQNWWVINSYTDVNVNVPLRAVDGDTPFSVSIDINPNGKFTFGADSNIYGKGGLLANGFSGLKSTITVEPRAVLEIQSTSTLQGSLDVYVKPGTTAARDGRLIINSANSTHNLEGATIYLDGAIDVQRDLTIADGSNTTGAITVESTDAYVTKIGAATLTLGSGIISPDIHHMEILNGTLHFNGTAAYNNRNSTTPSTYPTFPNASVDFIVSGDSTPTLKLDTMSVQQTESAGNGILFDLRGNGKLMVATHAVYATDLIHGDRLFKEIYPYENYYTKDNPMRIDITSVDAKIGADATLQVDGIQAFNHLTGTGSIQVNGTAGKDDGVVIFIGEREGDTPKVFDFAGTINGTNANVGLWRGTFAHNVFRSADLTADNLLVYGNSDNNTTLMVSGDTLSKLASVSNVYLRSDRPGANNSDPLIRSTMLVVGKIIFTGRTNGSGTDTKGNLLRETISEYTLNSLRVDATGGPNSALIDTDDDYRIVNLPKVELYANKSSDFGGTYEPLTNNEVGMYAIRLGGAHSKFNWNTEGLTGDGDAAYVDQVDSIQILESADVRMTGKAEYPFARNNSVLVKSDGKLEVGPDTIIDGNLTLEPSTSKAVSTDWDASHADPHDEPSFDEYPREAYFSQNHTVNINGVATPSKWNLARLDPFTVFTTRIGAKNRRTNNGVYSVKVNGDITLSADTSLNTNSEQSVYPGKIVVRAKPDLDLLDGVDYTTGQITNIGERFKVLGLLNASDTYTPDFIPVYNAIYGFRIPRLNADTTGVTFELRRDVEILKLDEWYFTDRSNGENFGVGTVDGYNFELKIKYRSNISYAVNESTDAPAITAYFGEYKEGIEETFGQTNVLDEHFGWFAAGGAGVINVSDDITFQAIIDRTLMRTYLDNDDNRVYVYSCVQGWDEKGWYGTITLRGTSYQEIVRLVVAIAGGSSAVTSKYVVPSYKVYTFVRKGATPPSDEELQRSSSLVKAVNSTLVEDETENATFTVAGMRKAPNDTAAPVLVGDTYVWNYGDANDIYVMKDSGGQDARVNNLKVVLYDGYYYMVGTTSYDITSFDVTYDAEKATISVPVSMLRGTAGKYNAFKQLAVMGTRVDGNGAIITNPATFTLFAASVGTPTAVAELDSTADRYTTDTVQRIYDINYADLGIGLESADKINLMLLDETPEWFTWEGANDTIAYSIDPSKILPKHTGTHTFRVLAYVGENSTSNAHAKVYTFTVTIGGFPTITVSPASYTIPIDTTGSVTVTLAGTDGTGVRRLTLYPIGAAPATLVTTSERETDTYHYIVNIAGNGSVQLPVNAVSVDAGAYRYHIGDIGYTDNDGVYHIASADFTITVTAPDPASVTISEADGYENTFGTTVDGYTSHVVYTAAAENFEGTAPEVEFTFVPGNGASELYAFNSTDVDEEGNTRKLFVVEGITKRAGDNAQTFRVTAKAGSVDAEPAEVEFTVDEDYNAETVTYPNTTGLTITGDSNAVTAGYRVMFPARTVATADTDVVLPLWLKPVYGTGDDEYNIIGVEFAGQAGDLANDSKATVRVYAVYTPADDETLADDDTGDRYYGWDVVYAAKPADLGLTLTPSALSLQVGGTATATAAATDAQGDVTYTLSKDESLSWVTMSGATVTAANPTEAGTYTVTVIARDSRGAAGQAALPLTITVTEAVRPTSPDQPGTTSPDQPGTTSPDQPVTSQLTVSPSRNSVTFTSPSAEAQTVELSAENASGSVTYTAAVTTGSEDGLALDVTENVLTIAPLTAGTYTVTITGRTATQTATTSITVTVNRSTRISSSGGGGCDAGFGALALVLAAPLFLRRRRS